MNTPTIAAALPSSTAQPAARPPGDSDRESGAPSFSQVLSHQHAANDQHARAATPDALQTQARADRRLAAEQDDPPLPDDEALAKLAGEQGLSLPQIALSLAAHALPAAAKATAGPSDAAAQADAQLKLSKTDAAALAGLAAQTGSEASEGTQARPAAGTARNTVRPAGGHSDASRPAFPLPVDGKPATDDAGVAEGKDARADSSAHAPAPRNASQAARPQAALAAQLATAAQAAAGTAAQQNASASAQQRRDAATAIGNAAAATINEAAGLAAAAGSAHAARDSGSPASVAGSPVISTPLQQPQWSGDFGKQVVTLAQNAHNQPQTAELRLDPPELGPLRITININDNVAHAVFVSAHVSVRHAVENALPQLQQQLAQAGISLGQTSVSDQGQQQTPFEQSFQSANRRQTVVAAGGGEPIVESAVARASARAVQNPNAIVDTFA